MCCVSNCHIDITTCILLIPIVTMAYVLGESPLKRNHYLYNVKPHTIHTILICYYTYQSLIMYQQFDH